MPFFPFFPFLPFLPFFPFLPVVLRRGRGGATVAMIAYIDMSNCVLKYRMIPLTLQARLRIWRIQKTREVLPAIASSGSSEWRDLSIVALFAALSIAMPKS